MELGMIGLGKMGGHMCQRLMRAGHRIVANARTSQSVERLMALGTEGAYTIAELAAALQPPRIAWVMVPAGDTVDKVLADLTTHFGPGDIIVDGGNSHYVSTIKRAAFLKAHGLDMLDCGTSGGVWGLEEGYSLMIGGEAEVAARLRPIFETLAPAPDSGWGRVGGNGAGHFVKMIHNGIEYGMMQALAEGFAIMQRSDKYELDLHQIAQIWREGSVVRSWLLDLLAGALGDDPALAEIAPIVADSGEGRWTALEALELGQPAPIITLSLIQRLRSRDAESFADRVVSVLRREFGGHAVVKGEQQ